MGKVIQTDQGAIELTASEIALASFVDVLVEKAHEVSKTWWYDAKTGERLQLNVGERLMLVVSELAESMEGDRKQLNDDHLPHRKMMEVELADALIRILDMSAGYGLDLGGAFVEKLAYNKIRADHKPENRVKEGGKAY